MPKNPYKLISPQAGRHSEVCEKNEGDPMDLLRSCMRRARYQISPEETVLQHKAEERSRGVNRNAPSKKTTNN